MKSYLPLIIGMMAVTYIPRLLPFIMITEKPVHPKVGKFLLYIPYTALSALIVRGIIQSEPSMKLAVLAGLGAAGICSWFKGGLVISVLVSIVTVFLILQI